MGHWRQVIVVAFLRGLCAPARFPHRTLVNGMLVAAGQTPQQWSSVRLSGRRAAGT
jgi:hypothetical protein